MSRGSKIIVAWTCRTVPQRIKSGQHVTPETLTAIACTENSCRNSLTWLTCRFWRTRAKPHVTVGKNLKKCWFDKKVLKRQFEKCSNDSFHKTLYFNGKSFCAPNGIYYLWVNTKIINSSLYAQKNHFSYPISVADDGNFSCHCAAESRHDRKFDTLKSKKS